MYAHTSSDKARFQPKISAAGFVCSTVFWYSNITRRKANKTAQVSFRTLGQVQRGFSFVNLVVMSDVCENIQKWFDVSIKPFTSQNYLNLRFLAASDFFFLFTLGFS